MMDMDGIPSYFPPFLWKFWFYDSSHRTLSEDRGLHIYDVYRDLLTETRRFPDQTRSIFRDFDSEILDQECRVSLQKAEVAFTQLEKEVTSILCQLIAQWAAGSREGRRQEVGACDNVLFKLRKYLVFLRFRNSAKYHECVTNLEDVQPVLGLWPSSPFRSVRRRTLLASFEGFLKWEIDSKPHRQRLHDVIYEECWCMCNAEISFGIASEGQEYILSDRCIAPLDGVHKGEPDSTQLFLPLKPNVTLYLLIDPEPSLPLPGDQVRTGNASLTSSFTQTTIAFDLEDPADVHLRNAVILHSCPKRLFFTSPSTLSLSITLYSAFETAADRYDYSGLRLKCRQKSIQDGLKKTLVVRGGIVVTDLTDEVKFLEDSACGYGGFADVWKGEWTRRGGEGTCLVAVKVLRQVILKNVKDKLMTRLKDEILAWHRLEHPHILKFHGIVQMSSALGMVSPWCENGSIGTYLREVNPDADRLGLLVQIGSAVAYLHGFKPVVVHGDLKGCNVLIDSDGNAIVTDFGLSKVMEDFNETMSVPSSFFAGSTRWMAPELILALVEDDGLPPPITTYSDVYAFASVCLEIASGSLPYAHRTNDHAVTVDIMRGIKPSRGARFLLREEEIRDAFWELLERCWDTAPRLRPPMEEVLANLKIWRKLGSGT